MSTITPLDLGTLGPKVAERIRSWTFPAYRHLLDGTPGWRHPSRGDRRPIQPIAFVALDGGAPAGLVLGCVPNGPAPSDLEMENDPELLSVYVPLEFRRRGFGGLLVEKLETAVRKAGLSRLVAVYMTGKPEIAFLERLLARRLWSPPEIRMRVFKSSLQQAAATPWYQKQKLDRRFQLFPWCQVPAEDVTRLNASHRETGWIADDLVPWHYDRKGLDLASSIGVRMNGEVVGWVINHKVNDDTVRFTCSFMRRDLSRRARLLPAICESIRRAGEAGYKYLTFTVPAHHAEMTRFAERWCGPWASFCGETRGSSKDLSRVLSGESL